MNKITKTIIIMIFAILTLFLINSNVLAAASPISASETWTTSTGNTYKYDYSGKAGVTEYDFEKYAHSYAKFSSMPATWLRGKYTNINTSEGATTVSQSHAFCAGHGNTYASNKDSSGNSLYKICSIIDITPTTISGYGNGLVGEDYSTITNPIAYTSSYNVSSGKASTRVLSGLAYYFANNGTSAQTCLPASKLLGTYKGHLAEDKLLDYGIGINGYNSSTTSAWSGNAITYANKVQNHKAQKNTSYSGTADRHEATYNGTTYDYWGPFQVTYSSDITSISVKCNGTTRQVASTVGGKPQDASTSTIKNNTTFYVVTTKTTSMDTRTFQFSTNTSSEFYKARIMFFKHSGTAGAGSSNTAQNICVWATDTTSIQNSFSIPVTPTPKVGSLTITKVSSTDGSKLAGAKFQLLNSSGVAMHFSGSAGSYVRDTSASNTTLITGSNGTLTITNLPGEESYTLKEIEAPTGYKIKNATVSVTIPSGGSQSVTVENDEKEGSLQIFKYDANYYSKYGTKKPLSGGKFLINVKGTSSYITATQTSAGVYTYTGTTTEVATFATNPFVTNSNGKITISGIPADMEFKITEQQAPDGYKKYTENEYVKIEPDKTKTVEVPEDFKTINLKIVKKSTDDPNKKVSGIGFKILCGGVYNTQPDGWIKATNGEWDGEFYSYLNADTFYTNSEGYVIITGLPLKGIYEVYEVDLGDNIQFEELPEITVQCYSSTNASSFGSTFAKQTERIPSNSTTDGGTYITEAYNDNNQGRLQIRKIDTSGLGREDGLGFKIYDESNNEWLQIDTTTGQLTGRTEYYNYATELTTDSTGYTKEMNSLPLGTYHVYETSLGNYSDIYELEDTLNVQINTGAGHAGSTIIIQQTVNVKDCGSYTITEDNTTVPVQAENTPNDNGLLQIQKIDTSGLGSVDGIGFRIYDETNEQWVRIDESTGEFSGLTEYYNSIYSDITTDTTGYTKEITSLPLGTYHVYETSLGNYSDIYNLEDTLTVLIAPTGHSSTDPYTTEINVKDCGSYQVTQNNVLVPVSARNTPKPVPGTIRIKKIDITDGVDNGIVSNIGFKIFDYTNQKWLQINNTTGVITGNTEDFEQASEITTDSTGYTVQVKDVPPGIYQVFETNLNEHINTYTLGTVNVYDEGSTVSKTGNQVGTTYEIKQYEETNVEVTAINSQTVRPAKLIIKKVDKGTGNVVSGIGFKIFDSTNQKWLQINNTTGVITGNTTDFEQATELTTDTTGYTVEIQDLPRGTYQVYETNLNQHIDTYTLGKVTVYDEGSQVQKDGNLIETVTADDSGRTITVEAKNEQLGKLRIRKIDTSDEEKLVDGIGFKIVNTNSKEWLQIDTTTGKVTGTTLSYDAATTIYTQADGYTITISKLSLQNGTNYQVYETDISAHEEYGVLGTENVPNNGGTKAVGAKKITPVATVNNRGEVATVTARNTPIIPKIKLSGYIWENGLNYGKTATMDNVYDESVAKDKKVSGIRVLLLDEEDKLVKEATTDQNGKYQFEGLEVADLGRYHVSVSYNGLKYQVLNNVDESGTNTNKFTEENRISFNRNFSTISKGDGLEYIKNGHASYLLSEKYITATAQLDTGDGIVGTTTAGEPISSFEQITNEGIQEITNINLGIYKRTSPDLEVREYIYQLISTDKEDTTVDSENTWQLNKMGLSTATVGQNEYAVTMWDAINGKVITKTGNEAKKVYIVYKVAIVNSATGINSKVNTITTRYYDSDYSFVSAEVADSDYADPERIASANITVDGSTVTLNNLNLDVKSRKTAYLYLKYEIPVEELAEKLESTGEMVIDKNYTEIESYTSYTGENTLYAGVDKDSAPGNINIELFNSRSEDDEGCAPTIKFTSILRSSATSAAAQATDFIDKLMSAKFSE